MSNINWTGTNPFFEPKTKTSPPLEKGFENLVGAKLEKTFKQGAVYLVKLLSGKKAVLKAEEVAASPLKQLKMSANEGRWTIQFMADLYQQVTTGFAAMRMLKSFEVPLLESILPPADKHFVDRSVTDTSTNTGPSVVWYMMSVLDNLVNLLDACWDKPNDPQSKAAVALLARKPELWVELGRILIVDLFVSNLDRFNQDQGTWNVMNPGNIFVTLNQQGTDGGFRGIDFFEGQSPYASLFGRLADQENIEKTELGGTYGTWPGRLLHDNKGKDRDRMAETIIADLQKRFFGQVGALVDAKHRKALREGMTKGREALKKALHSMKKGGMMPPGLTDRMLALGWK